MKPKQTRQNQQTSQIKIAREREDAQKKLLDRLESSRNFWRIISLFFAVMFILALCF